MNPETFLNGMTERSKSEMEIDPGEIEQFLTFTLNGEFFGFRLLVVHEILKPVLITRLPNVESFIMGVVNLRGEIIPIVDLKKRLHLVDTEIFPISRIIVVMINEKRCGILVDEVKQVVKIHKSFISYPTNDLSLNYSEMVESVSRYENHLILNLDFEKIVDFISINK